MWKFKIKLLISLVLILVPFAASVGLQVQAQPLIPAETQAQTKAQAQTQSILTIVLRDSYGKPLYAVLCEVLSYGWGLKPGEAYAVIARGETDKNGKVSFDSTNWPHSGYRFKFTPTFDTRPTNTFFEKDEMNQYRGYPAAVTGGDTETQYFFIASDGLPYNDLSSGEVLPTYAKNPVGGLEQPRVTIIPAEQYLATVRAGTLTAVSRGEPTPTLPPPPKPFTGIGQALTPIPQSTENEAGAATPTATNLPTQTATITAEVAQPTATLPGTGDSMEGNSEQTPPTTTSASGNLFSSIALAVFGLAALFLFWHYRHLVYSWLGLRGGVSANRQKRIAARLKTVAEPVTREEEKDDEIIQEKGE